MCTEEQCLKKNTVEHLRVKESGRIFVRCAIYKTLALEIALKYF